MKRLILWDHERGTWQYDVFCLMIVAFIFLTPNAWFDKSDKATRTRSATVQPQANSSK